ncbi:hypothetical protein [Microvirga massiliensis]|uniref:hypothetical protein n=1 Tax=Microvirga massiliensis TaxID=1033741 RepID=UPI0012B6A37E|nr:hypothetical protein [Microvirga massiliensis]
MAVAPARAVGRFFSKNWQEIAATVAIPSIIWVANDMDVGKVALERLRNWLGIG